MNNCLCCSDLHKSGANLVIFLEFIDKKNGLLTRFLINLVFAFRGQIQKGCQNVGNTRFFTLIQSDSCMAR